jgi:hypothetical protein
LMEVGWVSGHRHTEDIKNMRGRRQIERIVNCTEAARSWKNNGD